MKVYCSWLVVESRICDCLRYSFLLRIAFMRHCPCAILFATFASLTVVGACLYHSGLIQCYGHEEHRSGNGEVGDSAIFKIETFSSINQKERSPYISKCGKETCSCIFNKARFMIRLCYGCAIYLKHLWVSK